MSQSLLRVFTCPERPVIVSLAAYGIVGTLMQVMIGHIL